MHQETKKQVQELILNNRQAIKNPAPKQALKEDPGLLQKDTAKHNSEIDALLGSLQNHYNELFPLVKELKHRIVDITEESHICAMYLLLCNVFETWKSFFTLIQGHHHFAAMVLIRNIKEQLALVELFTLEYANGSNTNLNKWFSGEVITHKTCREEMSKFFEKYKSEDDPDMKDLATHIYSMESQSAHTSYISILESISPFSEDYDFEGYTSSFRTIAIARYATGSMTTTNIAMKFAATTVVQDRDFLKRVQGILIKYNPYMNQKNPIIY